MQQQQQQPRYLDLDLDLDSSAQPAQPGYHPPTTSTASPAPAPCFPSYDLTSDLRSRSPTPLDDPVVRVPSSHQPMERDRHSHSSGGGWGSIGSGSAVGSRRTPPNRSTTMDDRLPQGPTQGVLTQQWGSPEPLYEQARGYTVPRAPGLYNQQNHSSPSLALNSSTRPLNHGPTSSDSPSVPVVPSLDDINLSLESMHFQQRDPLVSRISNQQANDGRRYSPHHEGAVGQDGAMEIRGPGHTASVYSVDSVYSTHSEDVGGKIPSGAGGRHSRHDSAQSGGGRPSFGGAAQGDQRRDSGQSGFNVDQYADDGEGSFLPYASEEPYRGGDYQQGGVTPQPQQQQQGGYPDYFPSPSLGGHFPSHAQQHQQQQQYYPDGTPFHPQDDARHHPQLHPSQQQQQQQHPGYGALPPHPSAPYGHPQQQQQQSYHQQPPFQPQPPHGGWGYDQAGAAAQNPYYAAATGQLGFPTDAGGGGGGQGPYGPAGMAQLNRTPSSMLGVGGGGPGGGSLGRSQSSLNVPGGGGGASVRRKATTASNGSGGSSGPPITKASVDEYRQRIKADPDPEAQFNFAKYLIEAAKKINSSASGDEKSAKKYRDALLAESLKLIKRLATQGVGLGKPAYADAQFFLANCLGNGSLGLQVDHEKAYNLYVQASKQNHSSATYRTAVCNEVGAGTRRDHARAVLFYRKASALGDTAGMYKLGMILLNGLLGQQRNPKEAFAWLKRAASQADEDNPHALHELGLLYEKPPPPNGAPTLVPYDPAQARELFTQAGQYGYPPSQFKLGSCYEYGSLTCPVDPRRSIAWYTRAAERGDAESELALSGWYLTGSEGVLKQSDSEAYLWARRAANKGLPKAEYAVGYYSEVGIGVKQDLEEAKRWYMRAAAQGNKRAMQRLTELKKLGAEKGRPTKKGERPTRQEAETECVVM